MAAADGAVVDHVAAIDAVFEKDVGVFGDERIVDAIVTERGAVADIDAGFGVRVGVVVAVVEDHRLVVLE